MLYNFPQLLSFRKNIYLEKKNFTWFFITYYKPLCLFANSYVKDITAAEDIVEDAFIKLWEKRNEIRNEQAIYAWLCTTTRNQALNVLRSQKNISIKKENALLTSPSVDKSDQLDRMMRAELVTELHRLIHELPPQSSKVLSSLYIDDKSVAETAAELKVSVNTVKSHKARGIELLRHKLRPLHLVWLLSL